jgi:hypothetical protein
VNRRIIETVTSDQSPWFGFMNNGVSITAEKLVEDLPPSGGRLRVHLQNPQIINGCQTVNALYHAKYSPEFKDRFQGNSSVMVRIYEIEKANRDFLEALIIATNSQNAIRPQDLLSNDVIQKVMQATLSRYGVGYERKAAEDLPKTVGHKAILSKEDAAAAYIGIMEETPTKLRNSLSRREFFSRGDDYYRVFQLVKSDGEATREAELRQLSEKPELDGPGLRRVLEILFAWLLRESCVKRIQSEVDKQKKGALRKATYFLAWMIKCAEEEKLAEQLSKFAAEAPSPSVKKAIEEFAIRACDRWFERAEAIFQDGRKAFITEHGGNEDSALKNSRIVEMLRERWRAAVSDARG